MSRILELPPSDENTVISRILLKFHKTIDAQFPASATTSRQFSKTVFSDAESTGLNAPPPMEVEREEAPPPKASPTPVKPKMELQFEENTAKFSLPLDGITKVLLASLLIGIIVLTVVMYLSVKDSY